jgi:AcrR family transcriptional regulator
LREQLSLVTVLLARERGLANVRVDDIVERVGVSRRTFSNYFGSKEEAIADRHVQRTREAAEALRVRPTAQSLWDSATAVIIDRYAAEGGLHHPPTCPVLVMVHHDHRAVAGDLFDEVDDGTALVEILVIAKDGPGEFRLAHHEMLLPRFDK